MMGVTTQAKVSAAPADALIHGDCREVLRHIRSDYFSACITDPPYNYEFIGHRWDQEEVNRRLDRIQGSSTLVKNIPYGSGLAGGVRNERWYARVRDNILEYRQWCLEWAQEVYRTLRPGAFALVFNSTRTVAHVQVALEDAGLYARDILVYRRHAGIPKGLNAAKKLRAMGDEQWRAWEGWHSCLRNEWEAICLVQKPLMGNYLNTIREHKVGLLHAETTSGFLSNILERFKKEAHDEVDGHCTVKPLELMKFLVDLTVPNTGEHVILDPFVGSGTTCMAARALGHKFVGIELDETHFKIAQDRVFPRGAGR
jgi:site-specific DNA-methyltransferase (adenine-specific)